LVGALFVYKTIYPKVFNSSQTADFLELATRVMSIDVFILLFWVVRWGASGGSIYDGRGVKTN
jgi:hypothetical protein